MIYFVYRASRYKLLLITNLTHFFMYLFHLSACFEHHSAHHQEIELYYYIIWYDQSEWRVGMPILTGIPGLIIPDKD